ncbi:hypothetical protein ABB29_05720 [Pseudoxanthomonas dokdonensis]|uniref:SMP-30/Gluconolactonase/LRE-like region domain-containing protein n=1 Tax=Pseudoxanthomonas dokdonensis TaxID=344882 RepID=A0A0R0CLK4_9GAMM|nr:hypothetical protein ABB29_05720 [Pseudoxanthomonas dokdonensis]
MHALLIGLACLPPDVVAQSAPLRVPVQLLSNLPEGFRHPESLAVDPTTGQIYVGSFDARIPEASRNNMMLRLSAEGTLLAAKSLGDTPITGVSLHDGHVYFLNFGSSRLQRMRADFTADSLVEELASFQALSPSAPPQRHINNPDGSQDTVNFGSAGFAAINGMVFDRSGNLFVSDSFQGAIYRIADAAACKPCRVEVLTRDGLLATTGSLPFGANGLAFNADESRLYVNNAGDGRVLWMAPSGGPLHVLAESIHGADGLLFHDGLLWVSANQDDAVIGLDEHGRERIRAGAFLGIAEDGSPRGLLFPAASAVQGNRMIVANLALPLTEASGDEWEEDVTRWNLMQFELPMLR